MKTLCKKSQTTDIIAIVFISIVLLLSIVIYRSIQVPSVSESAAKVADTITSTQVSLGTEGFISGRDRGASISTLIGTYLCYKNNTINFSESPNMIYNFQYSVAKRLDYSFGKNNWAILMYVTNLTISSNACFYFDETGSMNNAIDKVNDIAKEIDPTLQINKIDSQISCKTDGNVCNSGVNCIPVFQSTEDWLGEAIDIAENPNYFCPNWKTDEKKVLFLSSDELPGTCYSGPDNVLNSQDSEYHYTLNNNPGYKIVTDCMDTAVKKLNKAKITVYFIWPDDGFMQCSKGETQALLNGSKNISIRTGGSLINLSEKNYDLKNQFLKHMGSAKTEFYIINSNEIKKIASLQGLSSLYTSENYDSIDFVDPLPCTADGFVRGTLFYKNPSEQK